MAFATASKTPNPDVTRIARSTVRFRVGTGTERNPAPSSLRLTNCRSVRRLPLWQHQPDAPRCMCGSRPVIVAGNRLMDELAALVLFAVTAMLMCAGPDRASLINRQRSPLELR